MTKIYLLIKNVSSEPSYYLNCMFPLSVDKPVAVTLIPEKETMMEGGSINAECTANCNPQPHMFSWLIRQMGQINKINSTERKMTFSNVTRYTSLSCIAHNDIGVGQSNWLDLDVQCKRKKTFSFLHSNRS